MINFRGVHQLVGAKGRPRLGGAGVKLIVNFKNLLKSQKPRKAGSFGQAFALQLSPNPY